MGSPKDELLLEYYFITQWDIQVTLTNYSRLRDCYWNSRLNRGLNELSMPLIAFTNILAVATNKTLTAYLPLASTTYPMDSTLPQAPAVLPLTQTLDMPYRRISHLWNLYYKKNLYVPKFTQVSSIDSNFIYCQLPQREQIDALDFKEFTSAFDQYSWFGLIVAAFGVTLVLGIRNWHIPLSTLLTDGVVHLRKAIRHSIALLFWMLSTVFIRNLYSAGMTSILINPPEEVTLSNIRELNAENYTLLFGGPTELAGSQTTYASIPDVGLGEPLRILKEMITKATNVNGPLEHIHTLQKIGVKFATAMEWTFVIQIAELLNGNDFVGTNKRCYIGKELIQVGQGYFTFLPPNADQYAELFQRLVQTGVFQRWHNEYLAMSHSHRVQDRVRVKGPTKVLEKPRDFQSLSIEGKLLKVFVFWALCLVVCIVVLLIENLARDYFMVYCYHKYIKKLTTGNEH